MAVIMPFRGTRYNKEKVGDIQKCVTMPYDRIKHGLQDKYYSASEYNVCRIVKNKETPADDESNNVYTRASETWAKWIDEGVVVEDEKPAIYAYHQQFTVDGKEFTRRGLCAMVELQDYESGGVKPHERTLDAPKKDRFKLLTHTDTHFGQIFQLYPDDSNEVADIISRMCSREPDIQVTIDEEPGVHHKLWAVTDPETIKAVQEAMDDKLLFIADGHHRYETAINYRNHRLSEFTGGPDGHNPKYAMMTMVGMSDPGLVILPTLRIIYGLKKFEIASFIHDLKEFFLVEDCSDINDMQRRLDDAAGNAGQNAFGLYAGGKYWYFELADGEIMGELAPDHSDVWHSLDVAVLHEVVLDNILGITKEAQAAKTNISYERDRERGLNLVNDGSHQCLFFMNPTLMSQIREVAGRGEVMPQKSTDFYPKLITGLVACQVDLGEKKH
ncbi:DUF1015 domain-containing protein [bacterium]|nr:DUF1015 domain-containing protein [bacterium]